MDPFLGRGVYFPMKHKALFKEKMDCPMEKAILFKGNPMFNQGKPYF